MDNAEIIERIKFLEKERYFLQMKDIWNGDDFEYDGELLDEIHELRNQLKNNN